MQGGWTGAPIRHPVPDTHNDESAPAYALPDEAALAQLACTGTLEPTFYASAAEQLAELAVLGSRVSPEFLARTALYAREHGFMKATPALLCALLAFRSGPLLDAVFHRIIDTGSMLRKFVGHFRSGELGRRSLGSHPKRLVQAWFDHRTDDEILRASVGRGPSLADVIRLGHVRPNSRERASLFRYLLGRKYVLDELPALAQAAVRFQRTGMGPVPDVPFQLLTGVPLDREAWCGLALGGGWQMIRMNLNTFHRHGVFEVPGMVEAIARRLGDPEQIRRARPLPYQLMTARDSLSADVPREIVAALDTALEQAVDHLPAIRGRIHVAVDVSGSMGQSLSQEGRTRCVDVAALFTAAILRKNRDATVLPFNEAVQYADLHPALPIRRLARRISWLLGDGTNCSAPLVMLNHLRAEGDLVILISDQESWVDARASDGGRSTRLMREWRRFQRRSPHARLVCLDLQPYRTVQAPPGGDVLHVGGFSDEVFRVVARFLAGELGPAGFVARIGEVPL